MRVQGAPVRAGRESPRDAAGPVDTDDLAVLHHGGQQGRLGLRGPFGLVRLRGQQQRQVRLGRRWLPRRRAGRRRRVGRWRRRRASSPPRPGRRRAQRSSPPRAPRRAGGSGVGRPARAIPGLGSQPIRLRHARRTRGETRVPRASDRRPAERATPAPSRVGSRRTAGLRAARRRPSRRPPARGGRVPRDRVHPLTANRRAVATRSTAPRGSPPGGQRRWSAGAARRTLRSPRVADRRPDPPGRARRAATRCGRACRGRPSRRGLPAAPVSRRASARSLASSVAKAASAVFANAPVTPPAWTNPVKVSIPSRRRSQVPTSALDSSGRADACPCTSRTTVSTRSGSTPRPAARAGSSTTSRSSGSVIGGTRTSPSAARPASSTCSASRPR